MIGELLVLCPFGLDRGLVSRAAQLQGGSVRVLVPRRETEAAQRCGAGKIHTLPDDWLAQDEADFAAWLAERIRAWGSRIILAPATVRMRAIMPMLAWRLGAGLTADCTELSIQDGRLLQIRPAFGNRLLARVHTVSPIQMATVRPDIFPPSYAYEHQALVVSEEPPERGERINADKLNSFTHGVLLINARIVVAGGLGVGSREGFQTLERLASRLGAAVAATRGAVDAGYAPYHCQVGLTGVTVAPALYLAFGISGAVQHLAGMSGAQTVVAINSDPKAPMFNYADYGITADWSVVAEQLLEGLQ